MAEPIGVAVIGAGMAGRSHAQAYRNAGTVLSRDAPPVRLVAVADVNREYADHAVHRYGFERTEYSWQAIAESSDIDAVSVVVANELHREVAEELLRAGKHVLCEKPLAPTVADAEAMVAAAATAGTVAACGFSYRRSPAVAAIADQIQAGTLGDLLHLSGRYWCDYGADPDAPHSWRYTGPPGSGALADLGSHIIDLAEQLCGPIVAVRGGALPTVISDRPRPLGAALGHARGGGVSEDRDAVTNEDVATFVVGFASGAVGTMSISRVALGHPNDLAFEVFGTRGAARFDLSRNAEFGFIDRIPASATNGWRRVVVGGEHPYVAAGQAMPFPGIGHGVQEFFTYQARAFLDEIAGVERFPRPATFAEALRNLRVQQAVVDAVRTGTVTEVTS